MALWWEWGPVVVHWQCRFIFVLSLHYSCLIWYQCCTSLLLLLHKHDFHYFLGFHFFVLYEIVWQCMMPLYHGNHLFGHNGRVWSLKPKQTRTCWVSGRNRVSPPFLLSNAAKLFEMAWRGFIAQQTPMKAGPLNYHQKHTSDYSLYFWSCPLYSNDQDESFVPSLSICLCFSCLKVQFWVHWLNCFCFRVRVWGTTLRTSPSISLWICWCIMESAMGW